MNVGIEHEPLHLYTQNPSFSAYTQHWVLYTWDELMMSISQVGTCKPLTYLGNTNNGFIQSIQNQVLSIKLRSQDSVCYIFH